MMALFLDLLMVLHGALPNGEGRGSEIGLFGKSFLCTFTSAAAFRNGLGKLASWTVFRRKLLGLTPLGFYTSCLKS